MRRASTVPVGSVKQTSGIPMPASQGAELAVDIGELTILRCSLRLIVSYSVIQAGLKNSKEKEVTLFLSNTSDATSDIEWLDSEMRKALPDYHDQKEFRALLASIDGKPGYDSLDAFVDFLKDYPLVQALLDNYDNQRRLNVVAGCFKAFQDNRGATATASGALALHRSPSISEKTAAALAATHLSKSPHTLLGTDYSSGRRRSARLNPLKRSESSSSTEEDMTVTPSTPKKPC